MRPEEVGQMVRFHRKQAGLTLIGLADLAGIGKTAVFDIEHGKATVRMDTLMRVLRVLNIRVTLQSPLTSSPAETKKRKQDDAQR